MLLSKDFLYATSVVLLVLFCCYEYTEGKPTIPSNPSGVQPNGDVTKQSNDSDHPTEDTVRVMTRDPEYEIDDVVQSSEEKRVRRDTQSNPCVKGYKFKLIDHEKVVITVTCADGCEEIKRVFFLPDREDPLVFPVDCKKKS
ncbi:hypothetical protein ACROYT_G002906 [Oculina patagonica]